MLDWLFDLLKNSIEPILSSLWMSLIFWRTLSILLLFPIFTVLFKREWLRDILYSDEIREHDKHIFAEANEILQEESLYNHLDHLAGEHAYFQTERQTFTNFIAFFDQVGNWYRNPKMSKSTKQLISSINEYLDFRGRHFFIYPENQEGEDLRLVLEPNLNVERAGVGDQESRLRYSELSDQLYYYISDIENNYKEYRLTAKKILGI